jgi:hypothetical protein
MKLNLKNIILGTMGILIIYYLLKVLLFIMKSVFEGIFALFTSGFIYLIVVGIVAYKYRKKIKRFLDSFKKDSIPVPRYNNGKNSSNKQDQGVSTFHKLQKSNQSFNHSREVAVAKEEIESENPNSENSLKDYISFVKNTEEKDNPKFESIQRLAKTLEILKGKKHGKKNFITFVKELSTEEIRGFLDKKFYEQCIKHKNEIGFGESGVKEFVGSILLMEYDSSTINEINKGLEMVFGGLWGPLDFSDRMDEIVNKSEVPYVMWSEVYRYLESNHNWIGNHKCAKNATKFSEKTMKITEQFLTVQYANDGLLDIKDVLKKIDITCLSLINQGNYDSAETILGSLFGEMLTYFRMNFENGSFIDNQYWLLYYQVLSDLMLNLATCKLYLDNYEECVTLATFSVKISTNVDTNRLEKAGELVFWALTKKGNELLVDPKEMLIEEIIPTLKGKAELLYSTIWN